MRGPESVALHETKRHKPDRRRVAVGVAALGLAASGLLAVGCEPSPGDNQSSGVDVSFTFPSGAHETVHIPATPPQAVLDQRGNTGRAVSSTGRYTSVENAGKGVYVTAGHAFDKGATCHSYSIHSSGKSSQVVSEAHKFTRNHFYKEDLALMRTREVLPTTGTQLAKAHQGEVVWSVGWQPVNTGTVGKPKYHEVDPLYKPPFNRPSIFPAVVIDPNVGENQMLVASGFKSYDDGPGPVSNAYPGQSGGGLYDSNGDLVGTMTAISGSHLDHYGVKVPADFTDAQVDIVQQVTKDTILPLDITLAGITHAC